MREKRGSTTRGQVCREVTRRRSLMAFMFHNFFLFYVLVDFSSSFASVPHIPGLGCCCGRFLNAFLFL